MQNFDDFIPTSPVSLLSIGPTIIKDQKDNTKNFDVFNKENIQ